MKELVTAVLFVAFAGGNLLLLTAPDVVEAVQGVIDSVKEFLES